MTYSAMNSTHKIQIKLFGKILFLNEIMMHILEYSGNRMTQDFLNKLNVSSNIFIYNKCVKDYQSAIATNYTTAVYTFYNALEKRFYDPDYTIRMLNTCKCCKRHQTHRPIYLHLYHEREEFDDWPNRSQEEQEESRKECSCICRHASRWLCRKFNPNLDTSYYTY